MTHESTFQQKLKRATAILPAIQALIENDGSLSEFSVTELAAQFGVTAARIRSLHSFFDDLHADPNATRICYGTSCHLAKSGENEFARQESSTRGAYCLGRCYQAPNALKADGRVLQPKQTPAAVNEFIAAIFSDICPVYCLAPIAVVTQRIRNGEFYELDAAQKAGAYLALRQAIDVPAYQIIKTINDAELRGRGGAGFPVAKKWAACSATDAHDRVVVINGDEGDPGSFVDRVLMESDPHALLEGLAICAYAIGATQAIIYVRSEYPLARERLETAIAQAYDAGVLGPSIMGTPFALHVQVVSGRGSYVCGEETAMLNAIEGRRGEVRLRPPYPTTSGLFECPTVVNNVETMVVVPQIIALGADRYRSLGNQRSRGTKTMCLNHGFRRPGLYEIEFGMTLSELIDQAGGACDDRQLDAVLLGGPMGSIVPANQFDVALGFETMAERGFQLGHGGVVAIPAGTHYGELLQHCIRFMVHESCGKCLPCSLGSLRLQKMSETPFTVENMLEFRAQLSLISDSSLCAFGQLIPQTIDGLLEQFGTRLVEASK